MDLKIDVEKIAHLARLSLSGQEKMRFSGQLDAILDYVEKLNELDTSGIEPTSHMLEMANVMREDSGAPCLPRDKALMNAPDSTGAFYRVPKIIE